jgi:hypothetical protein
MRDLHNIRGLPFFHHPLSDHVQAFAINQYLAWPDSAFVVNQYLA